MPRQPALHWNDPRPNRKTACGLPLLNHLHSNDPNDSTCSNCIRSARKQGRLR